MLSTIASTTQKRQQQETQSDEFIFVLETYTGSFIIGQARNCAKRIAAINSGHNPLIPESNTIKRIVGTKEVTDQRNLVSVVRYFCKQKGDDAVICV